jgi:hypothetical protein
MSVLELGGRRQLFIDDYLVDDARGVTKVLKQPTKYAGNPVLRRTHSWMSSVGIYGTVIHEPDQGLFRMWYQGYGDGHYRGCYATSRDGIFWDKSGLGLVEVDGNADNNVIIPHACVPNVIKDERDDDPERLYKSLFWDRTTKLKLGTASVSVAFSPDGQHWTGYENNPILTGTGDTHTLLGWDENHEQYVAYVRPGPPETGDYVRLIGRSVSDDFLNWTMPEVVLAPDDQDPPGLEFYGMPVFDYEGLYIGLPWAYHGYPEEAGTTKGATVDVQLAVSRDGISWDRDGDRRPFIPLGPPGSLDQKIIYGAKEPVIVGDELWFYYSAGDADHGVPEANTGICMAKLRLDGFVAVEAGAVGGTLLTKPFICDGGTLNINAEARGGAVSVAVLDEACYETDGYRYIDSALFDGDSVRHQATWRDPVSLDAVKGTPIRLKFYLTSASLYSFAVG